MSSINKILFVTKKTFLGSAGIFSQNTDTAAQKSLSAHLYCVTE